MTVIGPDGLDLPLAVVRRGVDRGLDALDPGAPGQEWLRGLVTVVGAVAWARMVRYRDVAALYRILGPRPPECLRLIPEVHRACSERARCSSVRPECGHPLGAPFCHTVGGWLGLVVAAWREDSYVVIVDGR